MKLDGSFDAFPYCINYVRVFLSDPNNFQAKYPRVWNAFNRACTMELPSEAVSQVDALIRQVFTEDDGPTVVISSRLQPDEAGLFLPLEIWGGSAAYFFKISTEVAKAYQYGTGWMVFEGTLLHESVHWVRYHAAGTAHYQMTNEGEVGDVFERMAYGFNVAKRGKDGKLIQYGPPETLPATRRR